MDGAVPANPAMYPGNRAGDGGGGGDGSVTFQMSGGISDGGKRSNLVTFLPSVVKSTHAHGFRSTFFNGEINVVTDSSSALAAKTGNEITNPSIAPCHPFSLHHRSLSDESKSTSFLSPHLSERPLHKQAYLMLQNLSTPNTTTRHFFSGRNNNYNNTTQKRRARNSNQSSPSPNNPRPRKNKPN